MKRLRLRMDPRCYNGAMYLGLQGVCVKSHGGTDALGFAHAVGLAHDLVERRFNALITEELARQYGLEGGGAPALPRLTDDTDESDSRA